MARGNRVELVFAGDDQQLQRTFNNVGDGARDMADDVGKASRRMSDDTGKASRDIAGGIDESEGKFRGLGDTINGTGDIMTGFREGDVVGVAMGFADLAGGITDFVVPALTALKGAILTKVIPALTGIATHPVFIAIAVGGAIIAGLILLEKKFGIVSGAIDAVKTGLGALWNWVRDNFSKVGDAIGAAFTAGAALAKDAINGLIGLVEKGLNFVLTPYRSASGFLNKIPGVGSAIPDFLTKDIKLPRLHTGGIVPGVPGSETVAVLQAGETVLPAGRGGGTTLVINVAGSVITERDLGRIIADQLRNNRLIGVTA